MLRLSNDQKRTGMRSIRMVDFGIFAKIKKVYNVPKGTVYFNSTVSQAIKFDDGINFIEI
jgi:hypothetical protein